MDVTVRLSGDLGREIGLPRVTVAVVETATVADVTGALAARYPHLAQQLAAAIPMVGSTHATPDTPLVQERTMALLTPVAGGAHSTHSHTAHRSIERLDQQVDP